MTILERKAFISSNPRIVLSSCPPPCGHFSIQESASGGLSYKVKIGDLCTNFILCTNLLFYRQADKIIRLATCLIRLNDLPDTVNLAVYIYFLNSLGVIP